MPVTYDLGGSDQGAKPPDKGAQNKPTRKRQPAGPTPQQQRLWAIAMGVVIVMAIAYIGFYLFGGSRQHASPAPNGPLPPLRSSSARPAAAPPSAVRANVPPMARPRMQNQPSAPQPMGGPAAGQNEESGEAPGIH